MQNKNSFLKNTLVITVILLLIVGLIAPCISSLSNQIKIENPSYETAIFNPFKEGWKYRKKVTINHVMVDEDLNNFPVLVNIIDADIEEKAQLDGDDILFMEDKGESEQLAHEIEFFDGFTGELVAWINIPYIDSDSDSTFYMYYGNPESPNQENPNLVWDSNYIHVWHLGDSLKDSVGFDDGSNYGTSVVPSKVGKGRDFESYEHDFISFGDMIQPGDGSLTTMTFEAWVKPESNYNGCFIMNKYNTQGSDYNSYYIAFDSDGTFRNNIYQAVGVRTRSITNDAYAIIDKWTYLSSTFNLGGINNIVPFIDGDEVPDYQPDNIGNYMRDIPVADEIGRYRPEGGTFYTDAVIDEVRWSKTIRSDAWIKTSYNTMNNPAAFLTFGKEEHPRTSTYSRSIINSFQIILDSHPIFRILINLYQ